MKLEILIKVMSAAYDKSTAYINLILIGGYASFYTVWGKLYDELPSFSMKLSAILMTISVLFFMCWELYKMIFYSENLQGLHRLTDEKDPEKFLKDLNQFQLKEKMKILRQVRIWHYVLIVTVIPGLLAGAIVIVSFSNSILGPS